ncbi:MAG: hypothetical protein ACRDHY_12820, partial [Anaerolineales bacterium]
LTMPREHLAVTAAQGRLYAIGGTSGGTSFTSSFEVYDPATDTWTSEASMPTLRAALDAEVVEGVLYAVGGYNPAGSATLESYRLPRIEAAAVTSPPEKASPTTSPQDSAPDLPDPTEDEPQPTVPFMGAEFGLVVLLACAAALRRRRENPPKGA